MASNFPSLNPVSCRSGSSFTSFSSARTLTTNRPASRRMSEISFVIRKKKKRCERKAIACDITAVNVEESDNYATECPIYERLTKAPPTLLDVCVRAPALVPVMLASGWLLMFRTRNGRQERPFLHHRNSGWCITPRLARPVVLSFVRNYKGD